MSSSFENKWAKNGFGENVPRRTISGKFTKEESDVVRRAVRDYCESKSISVERLCSECEHKSELKGSWNEIAKALPHRSVQSVYRHGLRVLHPFRRGIWTEDEINKLLELVTRYGKKWVHCQKTLNRSADACRDKYREFSDVYVKGRWKEHETQELVRLIKDHLKLQDQPNLGMVEIGKMVEQEGITLPWGVISKKMKNRSRLSCFKKFQKMTGLFSPSDIGSKRPPEGTDSRPIRHLQQQQEKLQIQQQEQQKQQRSRRAPSQSSSRGGAYVQPAETTPAENPVVIALPEVDDEDFIGGFVGTTRPETEEPHPDHHQQQRQRQHRAQQVDHQLQQEEEGEGDNQNGSSNATSAGAGAGGADLDMSLLSELANSGAYRTSEFDWDGMRVDFDAQDRWNDLVMEWQSQEGYEATEDALMTLPFYELAQLLLDRKASAKLAAETVEAVDLPTI